MALVPVSAPPPSYALEIRDESNEKEDFANRKCAFVTIALCPCLVILIIVLLVVSIVLMRSEWGCCQNESSQLRNFLLSFCCCSRENSFLNSSVCSKGLHRKAEIMRILGSRAWSRIWNGDRGKVPVWNPRAFPRVWDGDVGRSLCSNSTVFWEFCNRGAETESRCRIIREIPEGLTLGSLKEGMAVLDRSIERKSSFDTGVLAESEELSFRHFCSASNAELKMAHELDDSSKFDDDKYADFELDSPKENFPFLHSRAFPVILNGFAVKMAVINSRAFCSAADGDSETDDEFESCSGIDVSEEGLKAADPKEVERVCRVIEDLFALDRNMEAVLDQCSINLSHSLVVEVLARFCHARKPAFRFFCWAGQKPGFSHNSWTYNTMLGILGKTRQFESMVEMLEDMGKKGLLTMDTFVIAIRAFAAAREMKKAVGVFELMKKYNFKAGVETFNSLLDALGRAKLGKEAQALFEKMKDRFPPDLQTYSVLLAGWCKVKNLMEAGKVWNEMIDRGFKPDTVVHNIMLEGLFKGRRQSEAIKLFELMKAKGPYPNVRSYTILIRDLCKRNKMEEAVWYFDEMLAGSCQPDAAVYTCLIVGFGNQKKMDKVYGLLMEMKDKGCPPDVRTYNALIKLMTNRNMPDDAVRIYKRMVGNGFEPTLHTYNMLMKSYFWSKNYDMGCAVWEEMAKKGCCPDDNSYTVFIGGLISQGRAEEACKYIEEMINKGMKAPQLDYNKFAADFSRAGKPDILEELAQKMKFSGKFEVSNTFARWAQMMKKRVKRSPDKIRRALH